jgi:hypothetical protein
MVAHSDDLMLRLNEENCFAFESALEENIQTLLEYVAPFNSTLFPRLAKYFGHT